MLERLTGRSAHHLNLERLIGISAHLNLDGQICLPTDKSLLGLYYQSHSYPGHQLSPLAPGLQPHHISTWPWQTLQPNNLLPCPASSHLLPCPAPASLPLPGPGCPVSAPTPVFCPLAPAPPDRQGAGTQEQEQVVHLPSSAWPQPLAVSDHSTECHCFTQPPIAMTFSPVTL